MKNKAKLSKKNSIKNSSNTFSSPISLKESSTNQQRFPHEEERERRDGPRGN